MAKSALAPKFLPLLKATLMMEARKPGSKLGVTATGLVEIVSGEKSRESNLRIHRRYLSPAAIADPLVGGIFVQFDDVTLKSRPQAWTWWDMPELDAMYFGGRFGSTPGYLFPRNSKTSETFCPFLSFH